MVDGEGSAGGFFVSSDVTILGAYRQSIPVSPSSYKIPMVGQAAYIHNSKSSGWGDALRVHFRQRKLRLKFRERVISIPNLFPRSIITSKCLRNFVVYGHTFGFSVSRSRTSLGTPGVLATRPLVSKEGKTPVILLKIAEFIFNSLPGSYLTIEHKLFERIKISSRFG